MMMMNWSDIRDALIGLAVVCVLLGAAAAYAVPWLWSLIKPLIHGWTA